MEIKFNLNNSLFNRDPQDSELGKKILKHGVVLMDELGFESFTFKKLAIHIGSAEKSIYRYFDNKHALLLCLSSWYWEWVRYLIDVNSRNISDPEKKLEIAITNVVNATSKNLINQYIDVNILHKVIIKEGSKSYHVIEVDEENKHGLFYSFKSLVNLVAEIISEVNPTFPYSHSLASNLLEMANNQVYFAEHLPQLTSLKCSKKQNEDLIAMLKFITSKTLAK